MSEAHRKRWDGLVYEISQRIDSEVATVQTLRDQGDANFLVHQGRLVELESLQQRMNWYEGNFPDVEADPDFIPTLNESAMAEIVRRVQAAMGTGTSGQLPEEHTSFDDFARSQAST